MSIAPILRVGLPWLAFLSSFLLVLVVQPPVVYVTWVVTALGVFYLGFESRRLRSMSGRLHATARTMIRIGFGLLTAAALVSLLVNLLVLANNPTSIGVVSSVIEPLWILGTLIAFGVVLYIRIEGLGPNGPN